MQPVDEYAVEPDEYYDTLEGEELEEDESGDHWLSIARDAFDKSDDFFNSSIRKQIEKNIDLFNSRHPAGSKYHTSAYKYRSKIFRPKSRSSVRRHEAAAAKAYFSTKDTVTCRADDENDEVAKFGAMVGENLVNQRLGEPQMKWFATVIGAYQDAQVQSCVISMQTWKYKEELLKQDIEVYEGEEKLLEVEQQAKVLEDRPDIELKPLENIRIDPASDWRDPMGTTPYIVEMMPMYVKDVKARMEEESDEGKWKKVEITAGNDTGENDSTRQTRTQGRQDSTDINHAHKDYDIVWVHRNIINYDGEDYLYYTLGTTAMLSEPIPIKEVYPQGRPYVLGVCNLETHKLFPASTVELTAPIQQEANDIANQRLDNVKLVVNRRFFVRRNAQIDTRGLTESVPGGGTLVDDVNKDVRYDAPPDVTRSSYEEQDRLNNDFDELAGSFSGSSVASNRAMNETVGGMEIMSADANSVTDYQLRIFAETWLRPVLERLLILEKNYETNPQRLSAAGNGVEANVCLQALQSDINLNLSVGFGATNPQKQIEKLAFGMNTVMQYMPHMMQRLDFDELSGEIFGALGYQDGKRFFKIEEEEDPQVAQLKQAVQQLQMQLQTKMGVEKMKQDGQLKRDEMKYQHEMELAKLEKDIDYIDKQIKAESNDIKRGELEVQRQAFVFSKKQKELDYAIAERDRMSDILMRDQYGLAPGIDDQPGRG